ncbi:pyridoxal-dependent decarboxylase [Nostoc sp. UHCC 0302]|uniref:pyridoxal-dependent decarboxylase n=1 Tax=Nostoc sp. UHCC 0302 TaxID=3134896 RepID=UPI00311C9D33
MSGQVKVLAFDNLVCLFLKIPFYIAATVGTTSSHAIDPLTQIGAIAQAHNIWLHVDGAMSGTAGICPEYRWIHQGL